MERRGGATLGSVATFHTPGALAPGARVSLDENAAHHARVRRLEAGEPVRLTNGAGTLATGTIVRVARSALEVAIETTASRSAPPPLALYVPVADRERMLWLAEKATELAVSAWQPVVFRRSRSVTPRGEGPAFQQKVLARMISALEQSGGAWLPALREEVVLAVAADVATPADARFLLDVGGAPLLGAPLLGAPLLGAPLPAVTTAGGAAVMVGPEGGVEEDERALLVARGWRLARLGDTTLRFETAGIAACALVRAMLARDIETTEE